MFGKFMLSASPDLSLWEKIVQWYQDSFLCALLTYLHETYFTITFEPYQNFTIGEGAAEMIRMLVPALGFAVVIACFLTARVRVHHGRFVRRLLKNECFSPESAKTLSELDLFRNASIRRELSRGNNLRMVVRCVREDGTDTGVGVYLDRSSALLDKLVEIEESIRARTEAEAMEKAEAKAKTKEEKRAKRRLKKLQKGKKPSKEMLKAIYAELEEEGIDLPEAADAVEADAVLTEAVDENAQNPHASEIEIPTLGEDLEQEARKKDSWKRPKLDFKTARFYIPEALKYRAEIRFERRGSGWAPAVAAGILMVFATALICHFLPYVIGLVDVTISFFAP